MQALPRIILALFLFVGMPYAVMQATCEPLPDQTLEKAMRNEAPSTGLEEGTKPSGATANGDSSPKAAAVPPASKGPESVKNPTPAHAPQ